MHTNTKTRTRIALNMLVSGQQPEPYLKYALLSAQAICDELILINTEPEGKPNKNIEAITEFEDEITADLTILQLPIKDESEFNFGDARQFALEHTPHEYVLRLDADEVLHDQFIDFVATIKKELAGGATIMAGFDHFMIDMHHVQQLDDAKLVIFPTKKSHWSGATHEGVIVEEDVVRIHADMPAFAHYGYCKPQKDVYQRWQRYVEMEGRPEWYKGQNPDTIVEDRKKVAVPFTGSHPSFIAEYAAVQPVLINDDDTIRVAKEEKDSAQHRVGLFLTSTNNCIGMIATIESLWANRGYDFEPLDLLVVLGAHDANSMRWLEKHAVPYVVETRSLAFALNAGIEHFLQDGRYLWIGWLHDDMTFPQPNWIWQLIGYMNENSDVKKVAPSNVYEDQRDADGNFQTRAGNACPWIVHRNVFELIGLFNENFRGIGGYEDWELNHRIIKQGWRVMIVGASFVDHQTMGYRKNIDTTADQIFNAQLYQSITGTDKPPV